MGLSTNRATDRLGLRYSHDDGERYYNGHRAQAGLEGSPPESIPAEGGVRMYPFVSLAVALSWALSNADGGVRCVRDACGWRLRSRDVDRLNPVVSSFYE
jgi:hypothetical protein